MAKISSLSKGLIGHWLLDSTHKARDLSGYCIHPETRCFFGTGFKMAKDVVEGDTLYQDNGKFGKIKNIILSQYTGDLVKIKARVSPTIKLTPSHKVLIVDRYVVDKYRNNKWRSDKPIDFIPHWVEAGELKEGDYFVVPKPSLDEKDVYFDIIKLEVKQAFVNDLLAGFTLGEVEEKYNNVKKETLIRYKYRFDKGELTYTDPIGENISFDEELAELFGWYLAEGSTSHAEDCGDYSVVFTLSYKERVEAERIKYLLESKLGLIVTIREGPSVLTIRARNKQFYEFLQINFGKGAKNKFIPDWLLNAKKELVRSFLIAYNKGDGCVTECKRDKDYPMVCFETSSPQLVTGITLLLMKLGVCPNIFEMNHPRQIEIRKGEAINQDYGWDIRVTSRDMLKLYPDIRTSKKNVQPYFQDDENFYVRVSKVEREDYSGTVYDFETETHTIGMPFVIHNSNHGAAQGGLTIGGATDQHGQAGRATQFNGTAYYVVVPYSSTLAPTGAISICSWVYRSTWTEATNRAIVSKAESGGYMLSMNSSFYANKIGGAVYRNGSYGAASYALSSLTAGWHHAVLTYDGRYTKLYIDAVLRDTNDASGTYPIVYSVTNKLILGGDPAGADGEPPGYFFDGKSDDVRIYNRALSSTEITLLYNSYRPRTQMPSINESGLLLYLDAGNKSSYPGSGATWKDLSGNGYNATLVHSPVYSVANGGILTFDGSNDYGDTTATSFAANSNFTVMAWVKYPSVGVGYPRIICNQNAINASQGFSLAYVAGPYTLASVYTSSGQYYKSTLIGSGWNMVGTVRNGSNLYSVFNTSWTTAATIVGTVTDTVDYFSIAARPDHTEKAACSIAQILVYQRALSTAEILQNYNATKGRFGL